MKQPIQLKYPRRLPATVKNQQVKYKQKNFSINTALLLVAGCFSLAACNQDQLEFTGKYRLLAANDGHVYRLDTYSGEVQSVTDKGLFPVAKHGRIRMEIGRIYEREDGELIAYEGKEKFGSGREALFKQYGIKPSAP